MGTLFGPTWDGEPFRLFGTTHLMSLVGVVAVVIAAVLAGRRMTEHQRMVFRRVVAVVIALNIVGWHAWRLTWGTWTVTEMLPLHLCSVLGPVAVWALWTKNRTASMLIWLLGVPGAIQALVTPEVAPFGFPHYRVVNSPLSHGPLVLAGFWLVFVEQIRPTIPWVGRCFLILNVYALGVYLLNRVVGSNYLYLNHKPPFKTALDLLPAWPLYLIFLEALLVGFMLLFWAIGRLWGRRSDAAEVEDFGSNSTRNPQLSPRWDPATGRARQAE